MGNAPNLLFEAWITTDKTTPNLANQLPPKTLNQTSWAESSNFEVGSSSHMKNIHVMATTAANA
jgi:hypothetical protein